MKLCLFVVNVAFVGTCKRRSSKPIGAKTTGCLAVPISTHDTTVKNTNITVSEMGGTIFRGNTTALSRTVRGNKIACACSP